jgi:hypothetical protein
MLERLRANPDLTMDAQTVLAPFTAIAPRGPAANRAAGSGRR